MLKSDWNCDFVGLLHHPLLFGFSLFRHFWGITFRPFKLLCLAKDHWWGLVKKMHKRSILLIKSDFKWCIRLCLLLNFCQAVRPSVRPQARPLARPSTHPPIIPPIHPSIHPNARVFGLLTSSNSLRQCIALFAVAEGWLLLDIWWFVLFLYWIIIQCKLAIIQYKWALNTIQMST